MQNSLCVQYENIDIKFSMPLNKLLIICVILQHVCYHLWKKYRWSSFFLTYIVADNLIYRKYGKLKK